MTDLSRNPLPVLLMIRRMPWLRNSRDYLLQLCEDEEVCVQKDGPSFDGKWKGRRSHDRREERSDIL